MKMNWASVKAHHVNQACDALLKSSRAHPWPGSLIVTYNGQQLPAKAVLRLAYCFANNISTETNLQFSSGENSLALLRSLGFHAGRLQINPVAEKN
jgi:hypothetical protein